MRGNSGVRPRSLLTRLSAGGRAKVFQCFGSRMGKGTHKSCTSKIQRTVVSAIGTLNAQSSGLATRSSGGSNSKLQTGWGRNLSLEHRTNDEVQSHRRHSRAEAAAPVCAILTARQNIPAGRARFRCRRRHLYGRMGADEGARWSALMTIGRERPHCGGVIPAMEAQHG